MTQVVEIPRGSIEYIAVEVADRLNNLTDITVGAPHYWIEVADTDAEVLASTPAEVDSTNTMRVLCMVDATGYAPGLYHLYVTYSDPPQEPVLGPFRFKVTE